MLLESGAKADYREPTTELYPRTTFCDEPLRLCLKNQHYVGITLIDNSFYIFILQTNNGFKLLLQDIARLLLEYGADANKR